MSEAFTMEADVGAAAQRFFADLGFATFAEVEKRGGGRIDLVATRGPLVVAVECKLRLSWDLIVQGIEARPYAHRVYLAVPEARSLRGAGVRETLDATGLGLLVASRDGTTATVRESAPARWTRKPPYAASLRNTLCAEMNEGTIPGQQGGGYWTPFRATMRAVERTLRESGREMTTREIVAALGTKGHHYGSDSTARSCLPTYAFDRRGVLDGTGIVARRVGSLVLWSHAEPGPLGRCEASNCSFFAAAVCARCGMKTCATCAHAQCRCVSCRLSDGAKDCPRCGKPICVSCGTSYYGEKSHHDLSCVGVAAREGAR